MNVKESTSLNTLLRFLLEPQTKTSPEQAGEALEYLVERACTTLLAGLSPAEARKLFDSHVAYRKDDRSWNEAVDWLLNSRWTGDPEVQAAFWGMAEGWVTRDQAEAGYIDGRSLNELRTERLES